MEFVFFILLIVILVILISMKSDIQGRLNIMDQEIKFLRKTITENPASNRAAERKPHPGKTEPAFGQGPPPTIQVENPALRVRPDHVITNNQQPGPGKEEQPTVEEDLMARLQAIGSTKEQSINPEPGLPAEPKVFEQPRPAKVNVPPRQTFFERNPDLEKFIGENLVSKIGIAILVLAIAYFVKYAIDNNWIGPVGRVAVGLAFGGVLIGIAHRLRNSYKAFSSVLVGGGLAIFYFTITLAYHQFHLFNQTTAFIVMVTITGFAVALSLLYNRQEVAIIALIGGFSTPFILSNGSGNYITLFTYLIILNTGLLVLAYRKAWRLLNLLAFIFTIFIFWTWLWSQSSDDNTGVYKNGFLFATVFYLLFFIINLGHNVRENKKFIVSDFGIILVNALLYFTAGLYCIYGMHATQYKGLFSASMGVFNLGVSLLLLRNRKTDINIVYLLVGITLTFISLTAPLQFNGNFITLFWASEAVVLFALFQKSRIRLIETASVVVWLIMLVSLFINWLNVYYDTTASLNIVTNRGFVTAVYAAVATYLLFVLKQRPLKRDSLKYSSIVPSGVVFRSAGISLLFLAGALEIHHQFSFSFPGYPLHILYLELYTLAFVLIFLMITSKRESLKIAFSLQLLLLAASLAIYLVCIVRNFLIQQSALEGKVPAIHFNVSHWIVALLAALVLYRTADVLKNHRKQIGESFNGMTWLLCIAVIVYLSVELDHATRSLFYSPANPLAEIQRVYTKTVLPVLWGLCSFAFMWPGMKYKFRPLRIISLTLFSLTLLKLFLFDIRNIPVAGKIAAFFSLGVILLTVSFMYQRLKKIIIDDGQKQPIQPL